MARFRENGDIDYLGRADDQVKIHGFRIELGEIETAIMSHTEISDAAAVLHRERPEDQRLVVFYVPKPGAAPTAEELRQFLTGKLPHYMVPSNYIQLEAIPMTSSGKVDRRALAGLEIEEHSPQYIPPKDQFETKLTKIWQKVLGVEQVGMTDNFFELGGHSLLAAELFAKIEAEFGCTLPLAALFEDGTVSSIAKLIKSVPSEQQKPLIIPMQLDKSKPPIFLIPGGGAGVVYLFELAKQLGLYYSVYGFQSILIENDRLLTLPEIALRYILEIRTIQAEGPYFLLGHSAGGMVAFEVAHQLRESGEQVGLVGLLDTFAPGGRYKATWQERLLIHWQNIISTGNARELVAYFRVHLQRLFFQQIRTTSLADFAVRKRLIPTDRKTLSTLSQITYDPPFFDGSLTVFRAADRPWYMHNDPLAGWKAYARQVVYIEMTGSHTSHLSEPHVQELVKRLQTHLKGLNKTG